MKTTRASRRYKTKKEREREREWSKRLITFLGIGYSRAGKGIQLAGWRFPKSRGRIYRCTKGRTLPSGSWRKAQKRSRKFRRGRLPANSRCGYQCRSAAGVCNERVTWKGRERKPGGKTRRRRRRGGERRKGGEVTTREYRRPVRGRKWKEDEKSEKREKKEERREEKRRRGRSISVPYLPRPGPLFRANAWIHNRRRCLSPIPPSFSPRFANSFDLVAPSSPFPPSVHLLPSPVPSLRRNARETTIAPLISSS